MKKVLQNLFSRDKFLRVTLPIILVIILVIIGFISFSSSFTVLDKETAKTKAETFINKFLMQSGNKATVKEISTEYGLYKLKIDIVSEIVDSYLSKDGKLFFPQALDVDKISNTGSVNGDSEANPAAAAPSAQVSVKKDKPTVELFVMSYCPYGTQIEKGILPVVETLKNKIDFEIKFCSYAMHGQKELTENLNQYCIQKEQPDKLNAYLKCFLVSSDAASCIKESGVNKNKLDSCVSKTDKQYKVNENFTNKVGYQGSFPGFDVNKADNEKYGVAGSPTLVINGQEISADRDPASLLKTICSAFNNEPKECQTELSSASPAPGFGSGTDASGGSAAACQ